MGGRERGRATRCWRGRRRLERVGGGGGGGREAAGAVGGQGGESVGV